jgi:hypothetical protein
MMLMRTDPFRDLDRWTQQVLGTAARPAVMPMDAWREGDQFIVELDLPGIQGDSLGLDVERNVLTVHAERPGLDPDREMVSAERPRPNPGQLPRRGAAVGHPGRREGQAAAHQDRQQRGEDGDQRLTRHRQKRPAGLLARKALSSNGGDAPEREHEQATDARAAHNINGE